MRLMLVALVVLIFLARPGLAHELWIEPLDYQPSPDSRIAADIVNGEEFEGFSLSFIPRYFRTFALLSGKNYAPVENRIGNTPAVQQAPLGNGLHIIAYQTVPETITYKTFAKFQAFADHKDFPGIEARHRARGLPDENFREVYTRFSKSLVGVGHAKGDDKRIGLETEIIALDNPYTGELTDGMRVQLFYADEVRVEAQVELFEKSPEGEVIVSLHRTDIHGIATLPVRRGYAYMADAVVMREPAAVLAKEENAAWETLWANLTFSVPEN